MVTGSSSVAEVLRGERQDPFDAQFVQGQLFFDKIKSNLAGSFHMYSKSILRHSGCVSPLSGFLVRLDIFWQYLRYVFWVRVLLDSMLFPLT